MSLFEAKIEAAQEERRRSARFTIDIPACLRTISGDRQCRMSNISDNGAKLEIQSPPQEGVTGWLVMGTHEEFCKVIWANQEACGIEFERPLCNATLIGIAGKQQANSGPVANAGNIQMGRKRSGRLVTSAE